MNEAELQQDNAEMRNKISAEIMRPLVTQKEFVYIDADLLYDFRLGGIISTITNEEQYNYIRDHIPEYLDAPTLEVAKFFPDMKMSEQDIDKRLSDPKYEQVLALMSPPTQFISELGLLIRVLNTVNRSKETQRPIKVTVNQRKYMLTDYTKKMIERAVHDGDAKAVVEFTHFESWFKISEALLKQQDVICVYNIREFLQEGTVSQKLLVNTEEFAMADIMALEQCDLTGDQAEIGLENMADLMRAFGCNSFSFIKKTLYQPRGE